MLGLDKTLSLSLSLPCKDATVETITHQAAMHRDNVPKHESSKQSSNGLNVRVRAWGQTEKTEPKHDFICRRLSVITAQTNFQPAWLAGAPCPLLDTNAFQVLRLFQKKKNQELHF